MLSLVRSNHPSTILCLRLRFSALRDLCRATPRLVAILTPQERYLRRPPAGLVNRQLVLRGPARSSVTIGHVELYEGVYDFRGYVYDAHYSPRADKCRLSRVVPWDVSIGPLRDRAPQVPQSDRNLERSGAICRGQESYPERGR